MEISTIMREGKGERLATKKVDDRKKESGGELKTPHTSHSLSQRSIKISDP